VHITIIATEPAPRHTTQVRLFLEGSSLFYRFSWNRSMGGASELQFAYLKFLFKGSFRSILPKSPRNLRNSIFGGLCADYSSILRYKLFLWRKRECEFKRVNYKNISVLSTFQKAFNDPGGFEGLKKLTASVKQIIYIGSND